MKSRAQPQQNKSQNMQMNIMPYIFILLSIITILYSTPNLSYTIM